MCIGKEQGPWFSSRPKGSPALEMPENYVDYFSLVYDTYPVLKLYSLSSSPSAPHSFPNLKYIFATMRHIWTLLEM